MRKRNWLILIGVICFGLAILILRPVPVPEEKDCLILKGIVVEIYEGSVNDVVLRLKSQNQTFYINRGLERGLNLSLLRSELINKTVTIKYPRYWTPIRSGQFSTAYF